MSKGKGRVRVPGRSYDYGMVMPGQLVTAHKEVAPSQLLGEVKGRWVQPASVGLSPATVPLSSVPLPAPSPAAIIAQSRNRKESELEGAGWGWERCRVKQKARRGWTRRPVRRCPSSGLQGGQDPRAGWAAVFLWPCRGRQCKDRTTGLGRLSLLTGRLVLCWIQGMGKMVNTYMATDPYLSREETFPGPL